MKPATAAILWIGVIVLLIFFICTCKTKAQQVASYPVVSVDKALMIKGRIAGDWKTWLVIESHNGSEWKENGFDPSFTRIISDYHPLFRHLPNGQWEIMWTSEIAKDLP